MEKYVAKNEEIEKNFGVKKEENEEGFS